MKLTADRAKAEPLFLYYYFRSEKYLDYLSQHTIQTGVPHTNLGILRNTPLDLPSLPIQRRIAEILGRLDDKIEVNRRINRTLERMAQALYKHWFVDFANPSGLGDPKGFEGERVKSEMGLVPRGWKMICLKDIAQVNAASIRKGSEPNRSSTLIFRLCRQGRLMLTHRCGLPTRQVEHAAWSNTVILSGLLCAQTEGRLL